MCYNPGIFQDKALPYVFKLLCEAEHTINNLGLEETRMLVKKQREKFPKSVDFDYRTVFSSEDDVPNKFEQYFHPKLVELIYAISASDSELQHKKKNKKNEQ